MSEPTTGARVRAFRIFPPALFAALLLGLAAPEASAQASGAEEAAATQTESEEISQPVRESPAMLERVEEITVTARKREESLQDTPVSVVAFGADDLEARGAKDLVDLGKAVANLDLAASNSNTPPTFQPEIAERSG